MSFKYIAVHCKRPRHICIWIPYIYLHYSYIYIVYSPEMALICHNQYNLQKRICYGLKCSKCMLWQFKKRFHIICKKTAFLSKLVVIAQFCATYLCILWAPDLDATCQIKLRICATFILIILCTKIKKMYFNF